MSCKPQAEGEDCTPLTCQAQNTEQGREAKPLSSNMSYFRIVNMLKCRLPCTYILWIFSTISVKIIMDNGGISIILPILVCLNGICFVQINHGIPGWWRNRVPTNEEVQSVNAVLFLLLFFSLFFGVCAKVIAT